MLLLLVSSNFVLLLLQTEPKIITISLGQELPICTNASSQFTFLPPYFLQAILLNAHRALLFLIISIKFITYKKILGTSFLVLPQTHIIIKCVYYVICFGLLLQCNQLVWIKIHLYGLIFFLQCSQFFFYLQILYQSLSVLNVNVVPMMHVNQIEVGLLEPSPFSLLAIPFWQCLSWLFFFQLSLKSDDLSFSGISLSTSLLYFCWYVMDLTGGFLLGTNLCRHSCCFFFYDAENYPSFISFLDLNSSK